MSITDIERAIEQLSPQELQAFRAWFAHRDAADWDRQFEADVAEGKLDAIAEEAIHEMRGRPTSR
jgi:hypothetical protein